MTALDKNLSNLLGVEPLKVDVIPETEITPIPNNVMAPVINPDDTEMEADFQALRANTNDLLIKGKIALDCALDIVQQSDQPRAIEVFSTLLGQLSKINQEALDLHAKRRDIKNARPEGEEAPQTVNNNAIFVGSTAELNKLIAGMAGKPDAT